MDLGETFGEDGVHRGKFKKKSHQREYELNSRTRELKYYKGRCTDANLRGVLQLGKFDYSKDCRHEKDSTVVEIDACTTMENGRKVTPKQKGVKLSFQDPKKQDDFLKALQAISDGCHRGGKFAVKEGEETEAKPRWCLLDLAPACKATQCTFEIYEDELYATCCCRLQLQHFHRDTDLEELRHQSFKISGYCDEHVSVEDVTKRCYEIETTSKEECKRFLDLFKELDLDTERKRRETRAASNAYHAQQVLTTNVRATTLKDKLLEGRVRLIYSHIFNAAEAEVESIFTSLHKSLSWTSMRKSASKRVLDSGESPMHCEIWTVAADGFNFALW